MDITQLKYFNAIEEERNFTRAAKKMGVTQPALSHQIRNLEHEVGEPVLERSGRSVSLTPLGEVLLPHARALIAQLDQARNEMRAHVNAHTGTLRIGTTQSFNAFNLREIISEFIALYPNTIFNVQELLVPDMEDQLIAGSLDLGFSFFPAKHPGIEEVVMFDEALVAAAPKGLVLQSPISFAALCNYPMALPTANTQTRRIIDEHARQAGASIRAVMESNNIRTNIEMARELGLVTIASNHICRLVSGVEELKIKGKMPIRKTTMNFRKGAYKTKLLQEFSALARQKFGGE
jgi:LysR family cyn operon transcriptional activator